MNPTGGWRANSGCAELARASGAERGSGSVLMIGVMAVVMAVAWGAAVVAGYLVAGHRAKSIADLAAVSGASAFVDGLDGCGTALRMVERQGATARCRQVGDQIDFVITVTAAVQVPAAMPGLPTEVSAVGHAGPTTTGEPAGESAGESGRESAVVGGSRQGR